MSHGKDTLCIMVPGSIMSWCITEARVLLQFDMPETHANMEALACAAGFTSVESVKEARNELSMVVLLKV